MLTPLIAASPFTASYSSGVPAKAMVGFFLARSDTGGRGVRSVRRWMVIIVGWVKNGYNA